MIRVALVSAALSSSDCDGGPYHDAPIVTGPPINLVASRTNVAASVTYTLDQNIVLGFDRFLDPSTVTRQSFSLQDSSGIGVTDPLIAYDPVTLSVTLSPAPGLPWLTEGQEYRLVVNVPSYEGGPPLGLQAIDGATLAAPITLIFTANAAASPPATNPADIDFCDTIFRQIYLQNCAFSGCHAPSPDAGVGPILGLNLSSPHGVLTTAVGQVADESNTGPLAAPAADSTGTPFGIDMAVISAGQPGNSWMMYKVLLAAPAAPSSESFPDGGGVSQYDQSLISPVTNDERGRLAQYILGHSMPYSKMADPPVVVAPEPTGLTMGDAKRLSLWIAQGANIPSSCP